MGELTPNPGSLIVALAFVLAACLGFGAGALKRASTVIRLRDSLAEKVEQTQNLVPRSLKLRHSFADSRLPAFATRLQITANQLLLTAETIVKRSFRHTGAFDHAVDANQVHSILIKEL